MEAWTRALVLWSALLTFQDVKPWRLVFQTGGKLQSAKEDGSDIRAEPADATPPETLSPDGKLRVYVATDDSRSGIWVTDADGKNPRRLTDTTSTDYFPAWTPDGKRLIFASNRSGKWQIWSMEADGKHPVQLTDHADGAWEPRLSPAGDRIAYVEQHQERTKLPASTLRTMDLAGRDSNVVIEKTQMLGHAWSPEGDRLACSLVQELRILEMPSGKTVKFFKIEDVDKRLYAHAAHGLTWRPDGRAIACTIQFLGGRMEGAVDFGDDKVFVLPFEGKPVVIEAGGPAGPVRWTR